MIIYDYKQNKCIKVYVENNYDNAKYVIIRNEPDI